MAKQRWMVMGMAEKKKKVYFIKCTVDLDASKEESVVVKATKPHIAMQKAEAELRNNGHFQAKAFYCKEMGGDGNG